ncbi:hypothetical protein BUALT_Bualt04G0083400 [Buddleja alternifolia]|uniref:non-specific serine/threonine protein kinase n=1 Tax=Buddleja alternifolia TaxID=168488 RepID=A0AAV6XYH8_9LAMI|nr:hypothetical protein BUALT_Bualt04G0083400 [Buddleja alternifolia]
MNSQSLSFLSFLNLIFTLKFLILFQSPNGSSNLEEFYHTCGNTFTCGDTITRIGYPFRGFHDPPYCGHPSLVLSCDDQNNVTTTDIMNTTYRVLEIYQTTHTMRIVREDIFLEGPCPQEMANTTLDDSVFDYADTCSNFTFLYGCPVLNIPGVSPISCGDGEHNSLYMLPGSLGPGDCNASVVVPLLLSGNGAGGSVNTTKGLDQVLRHGFEVRWNADSQACSDCTESRGRCGYNFETNQTTCFCPDPPFVSSTCSMANGALPPNRSSRSGTYNVPTSLQ